ncbi:MAG TPA: hypothetical protein VFD32_18485 [Dehalococcoidia bacterium]|nr:hypothetical protein [Dehalococcoidia bacterium]
MQQVAVENKPVLPSKTPAARRPAPATRSGPARPAARAGRTRTVVRSHQHNDRGTRVAWLVGGGIALIVLILLGIGYYSDNIGPAHDTALRVGNHDVSLGYFRDRLKAETVDNGAGTQTDAYSKLSSVTDTIEEEQVYLQRAGTLGVSVDDKAIAAAEAQLVRAPVSNGALDPKDYALYESLVRAQLAKDGLSLDQFRQIARANALKTAVLNHFKDGVPAQTLAVKGEAMTFTSEEKARAAQQRLENGDAFTDVASDLIANPSDGKAQPFDWTPVPYGILVSPLNAANVEDVASKLQPGQVSDVIKIDAAGANSTPTWVLLTITDRDEKHAVSDVQKQQIAAAQQDKWLSDQKAAIGVKSFLDNGKDLWAIQHMDLPLRAKATPTPPAPVNPGAAPSAPAVPGGQAGPQPPTSSAPAGAPAGAPTPPALPAVPGGTP